MRFDGKAVAAIVGGTLPVVNPRGSAEYTTIANLTPLLSSIIVNLPIQPTGVNLCGL